MKTTYTPQVKEPVTLQMSVEDLILIRFCIHECIEREKSKARTADSMSKHDPAYKRVAKSSRREARGMEKLYKGLQIAI